MTRTRAALLLPLALAGCGQDGQSDPIAIPARPTPVATVAAPARGSVGAPSTATVDPAANATYALPGEFAPDASVEQLERRFGKDNVRIGEVPGAEGETSRGVILFPDDPTRRAYLYFEDSRELAGLQLLRVFDEGSRWHFDDCIGIGTPLSKLVALNGKPIRFLGLDWDYGGAISDWGGGRLDPKDDAIRRGVTLGARADIGDRPYPMGDGEFSSDDPKYPDLGTDLVVSEISVSFPGEDDL
jgi:hypothetical protein